MARFSALAGDGGITCGTVLNWLELDNRGNRLIVTDDSTDINTPAVAAAYATKRYAKQASDEISFEVGNPKFEIYSSYITLIYYVKILSYSWYIDKLKLVGHFLY